MDFQQAAKTLLLMCSTDPYEKMDSICHLDITDDGWVNDVKVLLSSHEEDHRVLSACIIFLSNFPRDDVIDCIIPFIKHDDLRIRYVVVYALKQMKTHKRAKEIYKEYRHVLQVL